MKDEDSLTALCVKLGAGEAQARVMAKQLLKRADQLAAERGITNVEALAYLVEMMIKARTGAVSDFGPKTVV